jgi:hypothetical protein
MKVDTRSATQAFTDSIVELQKAKGNSTQDAYCYLAGYLGSHLTSIIDQLPKAKRQQVLDEMHLTTIRKELEVQVRKELA